MNNPAIIQVIIPTSEGYCHKTSCEQSYHITRSEQSYHIIQVVNNPTILHLGLNCLQRLSTDDTGRQRGNSTSSTFETSPRDLFFSSQTLSTNKLKEFLTCSTQLSAKFQLLIETKLLTNEEVSCFKSLRCCIYRANKC